MRNLEYRVSWRRRGWGSSQNRVYQTEAGARRHIAKLRGGDPRFAHLAPFASITLEERHVGDWKGTA